MKHSVYMVKAGPLLVSGAIILIKLDLSAFRNENHKFHVGVEIWKFYERLCLYPVGSLTFMVMNQIQNISTTFSSHLRKPSFNEKIVFCLT